MIKIIKNTEEDNIIYPKELVLLIENSNDTDKCFKYVKPKGLISLDDPLGQHQHELILPNTLGWWIAERLDKENSWFYKDKTIEPNKNVQYTFLKKLSILVLWFLNKIGV